MKTRTLIITALCSTAMLSAAQMEQNKNNSQQNSSFQQTPRTVMDDEIAKNVHGVLQPTWISSGYPNVSFDVNNGTVNLRGVVETAKDKAKIEHEVKNLEGVRAVKNDITVGLNAPSKSFTAMNNSNSKTGVSITASSSAKDTGTTDKDRQINSKIRDKLTKWSPKGYETIVIATSNGVVTITGNVEKVQDIQKVSNDVRTVEGVKGINNRISVKKMDQ